EVDVIAEQAGKLMPLEIKSGRTISSDATRGLQKYMSLAGQTAITPTLIYGGSDSYNRQDIRIISWKESGNILFPHEV
ncbi:MAG: AAA family ATPase, partial [Desulfobulbus sp.]